MKKWHIISILMAGIFVAFGATTKNSDVNTPEGGWKNLQVLPKDISKDQLDSVMDEFAVSLNVHCNFCHARNADSTNHHLDFASDAKDEKKIARHMMKMTADINANNFNFNNSTRPDTIHMVICYTCHRGNKQPDEKSVFADLLKAEKERERK
jgi:hypothetical protein